MVVPTRWQPTVLTCMSSLRLFCQSPSSALRTRIEIKQLPLKTNIDWIRGTIVVPRITIATHGAQAKRHLIHRRYKSAIIRCNKAKIDCLNATTVQVLALFARSPACTVVLTDAVSSDVVADTGQYPTEPYPRFPMCLQPQTTTRLQYKEAPSASSLSGSRITTTARSRGPTATQRRGQPWGVCVATCHPARPRRPRPSHCRLRDAVLRLGQEQ